MLDTLVLLSGFISFFRQAEPHSNFQLTMKICESVLLFSSFYAEPALFRCLAYIPLLSNTTSVENGLVLFNLHPNCTMLKKKGMPWKYDLAWVEEEH